MKSVRGRAVVTRVRRRRRNSKARPCAELPPLIPRELLLGNPERAQPTISPDGKLLAWLAPDPQGVLQVWVQTVGADDARIVSAERHRGVPVYSWTWKPNFILYWQDANADENYHAFVVDLQSSNVRDLTPWQGARTGWASTSYKLPDELLVTLNVRDRALMDVWRINLITGAASPDTENPGDVADWHADDSLVVRGASVIKSTGGMEIRVRDTATGPWRILVDCSPQDEAYALGFSRDGNSIFLRTSIGSDKLRVVSKEIATGDETPVAASDVADAYEAMIHPTSRAIQAVAFLPDRRRWQVVDPSIKADFEALGKIADADFAVVSRDLSDRTWLVALDTPRSPRSYYLWHRDARAATYLFSEQSKLDPATLAPMDPITFRARDGIEIHGYLSLPVGLAPKNFPMVLFVHGGPDWRDFWRCDPNVQLFANRGYAVLQVNYRGSIGYGKKFLHAGDREFGRKMQDDLTDAVAWAVAGGIADPKRIAIDGGSYGGYAALAGATFTPDLYCCAVDLCGPSDLLPLIMSFPAYWQRRGLLKAKIGDPDIPEDRELIKKASPLFSAHKVRIPILIGQGANDQRVPTAQAEQILSAIEKNGGSATYALYPDEGHGFGRPENRLDFTAREEKFLAENLGGRYEPMNEERMPGSTATVRIVAPRRSARITKYSRSRASLKWR